MSDKTATPIPEKELRHLHAIQEPSIKKFVSMAWEKYADSKKVEKANRLVDITLEMLKKRKQIKDGEPYQVWVEIIIAAGLISNIFYDKEHLSTLFLAREKLMPIAKECEVPDNGAVAIFSAVEAQFGDDTPVEACRPAPGTPNELFAWAKWFQEKLENEV